MIMAERHRQRVRERGRGRGLRDEMMMTERLADIKDETRQGDG